jgi:hypothetical protein
MHILSDHNAQAYLLVDEVFIIVLDVELALHLLDLSTLLEELSLHGQHFPPSNFALAHQSNELASIFQLFAKTSKLFGTLRISTTSLADLANLASTETDKWITVVGVLASLELRGLKLAMLHGQWHGTITYLKLWYECVILDSHPTRLPVLVYFLGKNLHGIF